MIAKWLFAGGELASKRAAMVMSLVQSAKLHGFLQHLWTPSG